jgi:lipopolysaccharide export system permease protein
VVLGLAGATAELAVEAARMKILDRYILQTFLVSLLIVMAAMMGLTLLLDLSFNYNKFIDLSTATRASGFWALLTGIVNYYFYKVFDYFQLLLAPALLVAAAASLVRLNRGREVTGIKAAGISLYRVMWPMIVVALLLDGFYIFNQEVIIPRIAVQLSRSPEDLNIQETFSVEFVRDEHNSIIYAPKFNPVSKEMLAERQGEPDARDPVIKDARARRMIEEANPPRVRIFLRDSQYQARGTIEATRAAWDSKARGWRLREGLRKPPGPIKEPRPMDRLPTGPEGDRLDFYATNVGPTEIERHRAADYYRYMAYGELKALAQDPMRGNRRLLQVTLHQHVTGPLLNMLLLLLGLPFVAGREERNYFVSIGIAVVLVIGVFVLTFASAAFGRSGHILPITSAWLPVLVVLPASVVSMESLKT